MPGRVSNVAAAAVGIIAGRSMAVPIGSDITMATANGAAARNEANKP